MKAAKSRLQYLAAASLVLVTVSGVYDIFTGLRASAWYLKWYMEHYGRIAVWDIIFNYGLSLLRGTAATFGCGLAGLIQVGKRKVRTGYLLFLAFWTAQYILAVVSRAYQGVQADDALQMLAALVCLVILAVYKAGMGRRVPG